MGIELHHPNVWCIGICIILNSISSIGGYAGMPYENSKKKNLLWREQVRCGTFQYFSKHRTNSSESKRNGIRASNLGEVRNSWEVILGRFTLRPCSEVNIVFAHTWKGELIFSSLSDYWLCHNASRFMHQRHIYYDSSGHRYLPQAFDLLGLWYNKPKTRWTWTTLWFWGFWGSKSLLI